MNICSYTPTKYLDNRDINDRLKFLFKTVCSLAGAGIPGSGTVTSIGVSMPAAFSVANSPVTTTGTIAITGAGTTSQYIRGDGSLATYGTATAIPINGLTTATGNNTVDLAAFRQQWNPSGAGSVLGSISMAHTLTTLASNHKNIYITMAGAHAASGVNTWGMWLQNTHTGTSSSNVGILVQASGATTNTGLYSVGTEIAIRGQANITGIAGMFDKGRMQTGSATFNNGRIDFKGVTSGTAILTVGDVAETPTLTLPLVTGTLTQYTESATASSATPTPTGNARENYYDLTALANAAAFAAPSGTPANHNSLLIRITGDSTPRALTWDGVYRASSAFALPTTTVASSTMYIQFVYNSLATKWDAVGLTQDF